MKQRQKKKKQFFEKEIQIKGITCNIDTQYL